MSDINQKIPYELMKFYYEVAVNKTLEELFSPESGHGWSKDEFDKIIYEEAIQNAIHQATE